MGRRQRRGIGSNRWIGVTFDIRGIIQLCGGAPDSELFPERVPIPVGQAFHRLHALHGTTWSERQGREIGTFVLHYANGQSAELPIVFEDHLLGLGDPNPKCAKGQMVWPTASVKIAADDPHLYQTTFLNPQPELNVVSMDYVSKATQCGPFLVALTVE